MYRSADLNEQTKMSPFAVLRNDININNKNYVIMRCGPNNYMSVYMPGVKVHAHVSGGLQFAVNSINAFYVYLDMGSKLEITAFF